ncbi:MAG: DUF4157 domain-containing protein [Ktedonobacteraceae bacterium]
MKQSTQHTGDLTRIPPYTQLAWSNQLPPWLRLPIQQKRSHEEKAFQEKSEPTQRRENTTGLPDTLKAGVEQLSGLSMDHVQVHYHSSKPAEVQSLAYTQGTEIHVAPGQEQHLAHEAWHVVQQMQGRVKPTRQMKNIIINEEQGLEREAEDMGAKALKARITSVNGELLSQHHEGREKRVQLKVSPKGVIVQRYQSLGAFSVAGSAAALALHQIINGLSRNAAAIINAYDSDPHTNLRFTTAAIGALGLTEFEAQIGGVWYDLDAICTLGNANYHLGLQLNAGTPIRITIKVDPTQHGIAPANNQMTATLTHEITVHGIHALPWLQKLRSRAYSGVQIRAAWRTSNQPGALLDVQGEHDAFAQGQNRAYNLTAQNVHPNLPAAQQPLYQADIRADMNAHLPFGAAFPPYPI